MADVQCRMTTREGQRCSRIAVEGGMGFCWQHVPVNKASDREKWKNRIEGAALIVSSADLILKIAEFAVNHLHEFFGLGNQAHTAKVKIEEELDLGPKWETLSDSYGGSARVDWTALLNLVSHSKLLRSKILRPDNETILVRELEEKFDAWFNSLTAYHRDELLAAIEAKNIS